MGSWIDISRAVNDDLIVWPGHSRPQQQWERRMADGSHCNVSSWRMSAHTGTHMDAPLHFIAAGDPIDQIPPDVFLGLAQVVDLNGLPNATFDESVATQYEGVERLLLRSDHSQPSANGSYLPHEGLVTPAAAQRLVAAGLRLIGTDRLSVDDSQGLSYELHHILLGAGCVIVEGLHLADVADGHYILHAAPLRLDGGEASPVRALLRSLTDE